MSDQFDVPIYNQFDDRSFANAINRTYSRENLFNVLKYGNDSSMRGTYLELTQLSIAQKERIHTLRTVAIYGPQTTEHSYRPSFTRPWMVYIRCCFLEFDESVKCSWSIL